MLGFTEVDIDDGKDWDIIDINEGKDKILYYSPWGEFH